MSRYARNVDGNHRAVVEALTKAGAFVQVLECHEPGVPDLLVGISGRWVPVEVKDGRKTASKRKLNSAQESWHAKALQRGLPVHVVLGVEQALALVAQVRDEVHEAARALKSSPFYVARMEGVCRVD